MQSRATRRGSDRHHARETGSGSSSVEWGVEILSTPDEKQAQEGQESARCWAVQLLGTPKQPHSMFLFSGMSPKRDATLKPQGVEKSRSERLAHEGSMLYRGRARSE